MNILVDEAIDAKCVSGEVSIRFKSGHVLAFPIKNNPRLRNATEAALNEIQLSPYGIHWPALDEDLSFEGIMQGDYGQH